MPRRAAGARQIVQFASHLKAQVGAKDAARYLGVSTSTLYRTIRGGGLTSRKSVAIWRDRAFEAPRRQVSIESGRGLRGISRKALAQGLSSALGRDVSPREAGRLRARALRGKLDPTTAARLERVETTITSDSGTEVRLISSPEMARALHPNAGAYGKQYASPQDAANDLGSTTAHSYLVIVAMPDGTFRAYDEDTTRNAARKR